MDNTEHKQTGIRTDAGGSTVTFASTGIVADKPERPLCEPLDIDVLMLRLSLAQKCSLITGKDMWTTQDIPEAGIPSIMLTDGPHGLRKQAHGTSSFNDSGSVPATCFPTASALACSFDVDLMHRIGCALGEECRANDVAVLLGPGVNMKRSPLCGRNFEYLSEDPILAGKLAAAYINGVQEQGVGVSLKHFACNSQEKRRMTSDSIVDDRALFEYYLRAFEIAVHDGQPWTIMAAYNRLNGSYCCENKRLLTDIARDAWGFEGLFVSDWGAQSSNEKSLPAGLDLVMPGRRPDYRKDMKAAVKAGAISETDLDNAAERVLTLINRHIEGQRIQAPDDAGVHLHLAQEAAEQSAVLLKNDGILPLDDTKGIAIIGEFARKPRYQGSGSSQVNPIELDNAYEAFCDAGVPIIYARGYDAQTGKAPEWMLREAEMAAANKDVAVVFAGLPDSYETEGLDRANMNMPPSFNELIERVCATNPNTVVVLQCGAPIEMPWRDKPRAILLDYLSGCQGGKATANLLLGRANPSGKLAETWPATLDDTFLGNTFPDEHARIYYNESIFVGYRYYDTANVEVAYPFGHGLSYTDFAYDDLSISVTEGRVVASCRISNTGKTTGRETVQLYVAPISPAVFKATQELKAFSKVELAAGESSLVEMTLGRRAFSHFDRDSESWQVEEGDYEIRIGSSSRDIRLSKPVHMDGEPKREDKAPDWYHSPTPDGFVKQYFRRIYRKPMPTEPPKSTYTVDSSVSDIGETPVGKLLVHILSIQMRKMTHDEPNMLAMMQSSLFEMPLRSLTMLGISMDVARGVAEMANSRTASGLGKVASGLISQLRKG